MAVLSLPLSFTNSFWSQDYRKGLEVLYHKLEQVRRSAALSGAHLTRYDRESRKMRKLSRSFEYVYTMVPRTAQAHAFLQARIVAESQLAIALMSSAVAPAHGAMPFLPMILPCGSLQGYSHRLRLWRRRWRIAAHDLPRPAE